MSTVSLKLQAKKKHHQNRKERWFWIFKHTPVSNKKNPTKQLNQRITKPKNIYDLVLYLFLIQERELFTTYMYVFFSGHK